MPHPRNRTRALVTADQLDRYVTGELHKLDGFDAVTVSVGYRLREVDDNGRNWTGDLVPCFGRGAPSVDTVAAALRPIARAARARYNLSE